MKRFDRPPTAVKLLGVLGVVGAASVFAGGCQMAKPADPATPGPTTMATTMPTMEMPAPPPVAKPSVAPALDAKPPMAADMTHTLSKDQPYFTTMPTGIETPAGMLKAGSKVLLMIPGAKFSKVTTDAGMTAYTMTEALEPIGKK